MHRIEIKRQQIVAGLAAAELTCGRSLLRVAQVMTAAPDCVRLGTSVLELVRMFHAKGFRHLPVVDDRGRLVGILSDRDVLRSLGPDAPDKEALAAIPAADLMSTDLVTVGPEDSLVTAVKLLLDHGISSLPVLTDGVLVGILTTTDLYLTLQILLQGASSPRASEAMACEAF
jgi:acetoin utilization protein AcuB